MARRCFLALWPPPSTREALAALSVDLAAHQGGRAVPARKIHLTLAFLGDLGDRHLASVMQECGRIESPAVDFALDRIGSFSKGRLAWAGALQPPEDVAALVFRIQSAVARSSLPVERRAFALHVTLVRDCERPVPGGPIDPVSWTSSRFALVESDLRAGRYGELGSWNLGLGAR